jgi:hypothetical protein
LRYFVWKITILRQKKITFFPILGGGGEQWFSCCSTFLSHHRYFNNEQNLYPNISVTRCPVCTSYPNISVTRRPVCTLYIPMSNYILLMVVYSQATVAFSEQCKPRLHSLLKIWQCNKLLISKVLTCFSHKLYSLSISRCRSRQDEMKIKIKEILS